MPLSSPRLQKKNLQNFRHIKQCVQEAVKQIAHNDEKTLVLAGEGLVRCFSMLIDPSCLIEGSCCTSHPTALRPSLATHCSSKMADVEDTLTGNGAGQEDEVLVDQEDEHEEDYESDDVDDDFDARAYGMYRQLPVGRDAPEFSSGSPQTAEEYLRRVR